MENEVATKKDIAQLVTKEEFKKELDKLLTKEEFRKELKKELKKELSKYATKDDLRFEINELRKDMKEIDERHNQRYNKILEILDGIAEQITNNRVERAAMEATFQRHERKLEDHEVRILQLEQQSA